MNKSELIDVVSEKSGQPKSVCAVCIDLAFECIMATVANGEQASFIGFGVFKPSPRKARQAKNPKTGEALQIAATTVPKFTPSSNFKKQVASI